MPRARSACAISVARGAGVLAGSATSTADGTARDPVSAPLASSGTSSRVTPSEMPTPGIGGLPVAGQRVVAAAGADRAEVLVAGHPGLEDGAGVVVQAAGDAQVGLDGDAA